MTEVASVSGLHRRGRRGVPVSLDILFYELAEDLATRCSGRQVSVDFLLENDPVEFFESFVRDTETGICHIGN